jgi:hypothetical protein
MQSLRLNVGMLGLMVAVSSACAAPPNAPGVYQTENICATDLQPQMQNGTPDGAPPCILNHKGSEMYDRHRGYLPPHKAAGVLATEIWNGTTGNHDQPKD